jgi:hypothetical protein
MVKPLKAYKKNKSKDRFTSPENLWINLKKITARKSPAKAEMSLPPKSDHNPLWETSE